MSTEGRYGDETTRRRILEAAHEIVAERGARLTLADVAERAGVSRQALYLHFGDRTRLLVALVEWMDEDLHLEQSLEHVRAAPTSEELIARTMALHADFSAAIDSIAMILEGAQYQDEALGTAWRNRMRFRHLVHRRLTRQIAAAGDLAAGWTEDTAADLFYAVTLPGPWRELTRELGWSQERYVTEMTALLCRALLVRAPSDPRGGKVPSES